MYYAFEEVINLYLESSNDLVFCITFPFLTLLLVHCSHLVSIFIDTVGLLMLMNNRI